LVVVIFGFLVLTVIDQWAEIQDEGVHFHVGWLLPALVVLPGFYVLSAFGWDLILRFLGYRIGFGRAQVAWGQPLPARYVPGSVLYVLGRVLLSERAGVPRRVTIASIVYEQAISATSAIVIATYFIISHPDLQGEPARWAVLLFTPAAVVLLHPRVFGPLVNRVLGAFGREPLPDVISLRGVLSLIAFFTMNWVVVSFGIYCVARSVTEIPFNDVLLVGAAQAIGYFAALVTLVAPAGLGVRDLAFAWAVKAAVPGQKFATGSLIAIAVRGMLTVTELMYVAAVTALGRREGWSIPTGILHPSPEEEEAGPKAGAHSPEIL
jgi:glycosyltransferase 2 family protein